MTGRQDYLDIALIALEVAVDAGADAAEAFVSNSQSVQVEVSDRAVEKVNAVNDAGIGIRILKDQKMVFGSSNDLSRDSVDRLISDLIQKVPYHTPDEFNVIPGKEFGFLEGDWSSYTDLISHDPRIAEAPIEAKIRRALQLEAVGLEHNPKITGSMTTIYLDQSDTFYLANSLGIRGYFPTSYCGGYVEFIATEGEDRQSGGHMAIKGRYDEFDPEAVSLEAAEKALRMLGAKPIESCEVPMVVDPSVGAELFGYIVGMLSADAVQKGTSLFAGKLEEKVAADSITLIDDGRLKGGLATSPVDGEGIPRQTTPLITDGVLKNYLYDCYTAKKGNCKSTGNRSRGSYQGQGGIGSTNLFMEAGSVTPAQIISGIDDGFYITQAFGLHAGVDPTSGDFSLPAAGFKIENGETTFPIRGISIGGNLFEFLKAVDRIGNDLTWFQTTGCPTFSLTSIKIGGV